MSGRRLRAAISLAGAVALASCGLAAASADASPSIGGFSVQPAESSAKNPLTRAYFIQTVRPGHAVTVHATIANSGATPIELLVGPVDGLTGTTSGVVYANRQDRRTQAGLWLHSQASRVRLAGDAHTVIGLTITVPAGATPGDHVAGLAVENAHPSKTGGHFSITEVVRAVVGVEIIVPGKASTGVALHGTALRALPGTNYPSLIITVENAGQLLCKPHLQAWLQKGAHGRWVSRQLDTILPGDKINYPLPWPTALAAGKYRTSVLASKCGHRRTLNATASLAGALLRTTASQPPSSSTPAASAGGGVSWLLFALIGVGGIGLGALLSRRPWRHQGSV